MASRRSPLAREEFLRAGRQAALLEFEHFEVGPRHVFEPSEGRPEIEIGSHQRLLPLALDRPCSLPPSLAQIRCWMIGRTTPRPRYGSQAAAGHEDYAVLGYVLKAWLMSTSS